MAKSGLRSTTWAARRPILLGAAAILAVSLWTTAGLLDQDQTAFDGPTLRWNLAALPEAEQFAVDHWLGRIGPDGLFTYIVDLKDPEYDPGSDNVVRQAMSSRLLAELATECPAMIPVHRRNMEAVIDLWYREDSSGAGRLEFDEKAKAGASGVFLQAIARSPLRAESREVAEGLVNGLLDAWAGDRDLDPWLLEPDYGYDRDYLLTFYSGEVILGLQEIGDVLPESFAERAALGMQQGFARLYVDRIEDAFYPAYVPWHTMSMKRYALHGPNPERWSSAIVTITDRLLTLQDSTSHPGRFHHPEFPEYGRPHASSDGVFVEGLVHAFEVAKVVGDADASTRFLRGLARGSSYLIERQIGPTQVQGWQLDSAALGAIPDQEGGFRVRIDNLQHAIDAFRAISRLIREGMITGEALDRAGIRIDEPFDPADFAPVCPSA